ncbi:uncharacterized protein [Henckelia pumila]|uniref:uncharacterized protein n=1 Tax=Henckelia pumila TaxID=405737 RepID=UPI003C6E8FAE
MACFTVVEAPSSFNGILGHPALSDFRAVASTYHQKLKFPSGREVGVVRGDQKAARLCYVNEVRIDSKKKKREVGMVSIGRTSKVHGYKVLLMSEEGHEKVELIPGAQIVKLAADLSPSVKQNLVGCLKKNKDVFAWSVSELTGNAGATYQRLMDRVFASQIGRNVEVYVDDILVKSQDDVGLLADLKETFSTLRAYQVKLNPEKCVFGVRGGKFLGYMVTERGIEANPEKVQAIRSMFAPRNLQEVQRLAGRIAALSRFISRSAHRSLPFFKVLRKAKKFEWDDECGKAFDDLKSYLAELLCWLRQFLVNHCTSTYQLWKGLLAQYLLGRREQLNTLSISSHMPLRVQNFGIQSHIGRILTRVDISGRLVKWTTELSEYDIQYEPRTAVKAQALADFLAKTRHMEAEDLWKVYVDGSSNSEGCGVGVFLISPRGDEIRLAVRLDFRASNNEAEYEAVLIGLRAAKQAGTARVHLYSDSQLVAQQVNGTYEVKNEKLKEYMRAIEEAKGFFDEVLFEQIPREGNEKADYLAKMASSLHNWKTREVVVQV